MGALSPGQVRSDEFSERGLSIGNLDEVLALGAAAFQPPWGRQDFAYFLAHEHGRCYGAFAPDGTLAAYFLGLWTQGDLDVISVATRPDRRRSGLALRLLETACRDATVERVFLEVAVDNEGAVALYQKAGFVKSFVRRQYYEGKRDAFVMTRTCESSCESADR